MPDINLTQRLVAKLITQSYQAGAPAFDPAVSKNPSGLATDPDFLAVNPGLKGLTSSLGDVLMPFGSSDLIKELWTWVSADPDAKAFLDGTPDPWGMVVNPAYKGITDAGAINDFPKNDSYCTTANLVPGQTPPCTLDARPYADDMHVAARSAARGDSLAKTLWDVTAIPPGYKKQPTQLTGVRHVMAFTDAATAVRYSLPVAHLRNASGSFVSPTTDALSAGVAAMTPTAVAGVLAPNPTTSSATAYPLTAITYAATVPAVLTGDTRTAFAAFLKYAATTGQQLGLDAGQLPYGYLPLTDAMSWQTLQLATELFAPAPATSTPAPSVTPTKTHAKPSVKPTKPKPSKSVVATSASPAPTARRHAADPRADKRCTRVRAAGDRADHGSGERCGVDGPDEADPATGHHSTRRHDGRRRRASAVRLRAGGQHPCGADGQGAGRRRPLSADHRAGLRRVVRILRTVATSPGQQAFPLN